MTKPFVKLAAPCSWLDVEKFQSWLEDMAKQGCLLHKPAGLRHNYLFHKISPLPVRYRLTPVSNNFEDWNQRPDTGNQTLAEAFGWEYVCTVGGFHIYRSYNAEDRELHSDPDVLAESIRLLRRKALLAALTVLICPVVFVLFIGILVGYGHIWRYLIRDGIMLYASLGLISLFATLKGIDRSVKLVTLRRLLEVRKLPVHHQNWKPGARKFRFRIAVTYLIGLLLIVSVCGFRLSDQNAHRSQSLPEDSSSLPFATVLNLAEESGFPSVRRLDVGWMVSWSQPFADVNYEWVEFVDVVTAEGTEGRFSIEISYHELNSGWLADRFTAELMKQAQSIGTPADVPLPAGADQAYFYTDQRGCPAAVIRDGNTVIWVSFLRADFEDGNLNLDSWIAGTINP